MRDDTDTSVSRIRFLREKDAEAVRARTYKGTSVIVLLSDPGGNVLLNLRDDKPGVLHPGHWAIIGGGVEDGRPIAGGWMETTPSATGTSGKIQGRDEALS